jgi:hypothetical protein
MAIALRSIGLVVAALIVGAASACAGDWSINQVLSGKVDFNDNPGLAINSAGYVVHPTEILSTDFIYTMPDGKFDLLADVVRNDFFGPGSGSARGVFLPHATMHYNKFGPRSSFDASASYGYEQVEFVDTSIYDNCDPIPGTTLLDCDGVITDPVPLSKKGSKQSFSGNATYNLTFDPRNSMSWSHSASHNAFTKSSGSDSSTYSTMLSFSRKLTKRNDGSINFGFDWLGVDDVSNLERAAFSTKVSLTSRLSNRVTLRSGAGIKVVNVYTDDLALPGNPRSSQQSLNGSANLGLDYLLNNTTSMSLNATIAANQQSDNSFLNRYTTTLSASRQINELSSFKLSTGMTFSETRNALSGKDIISSFNISPSYTRQLGREWSMSAAYKFSLRNGPTGTATANDVNFSISRNFVVMP